MPEVRWERLRPRAMEARVQDNPVVYVPFGSLEWHGYHNPLGLDTIKARALCLRAAEQGGGVVAPATYWPIGGMPHPWTVRMDEDLIHRLAVAIYEQMAHVGFQVIIAVTGHYGHEQVVNIKGAALEVMYRTGLSIYALAEYEVAVGIGYRGDHAAKWETSLAWALYPDLVDLSEAEPAGEPLDGVGGEDPRTYASTDLGEQAAQVIVQGLTAMAHRLQSQSQRERSLFIEASAAHLRVLERNYGPAFSTPEYWQGISAIAQGAYLDAITAFRAAGRAAARQ